MHANTSTLQFKRHA
jgi:hypothetical protein